jgi:hypothetical protein
MDRHGSAPSPGIKLPHAVIVKAPGLLPMLYSPSELEGELGVPARTIRDWLRWGVPHQRDETEHIWINGQEFAAWVKAIRTAARRTVPLKDGQAFCVGCRAAVTVLEPQRRRNGNRVLLSGRCPTCGRTIHRGIRDDQPAELPLDKGLP